MVGISEGSVLFVIETLKLQGRISEAIEPALFQEEQGRAGQSAQGAGGLVQGEA